ncbi:MAG: hypothetical protein NXI04_22275 [Planctomycetaceae bacterium]|nr:hypothetical protein [Planctomycetaceae bacterium]
MSSNLQKFTRPLQRHAVTILVVLVQLAVVPATCLLHVCGDAANAGGVSGGTHARCCCHGHVERSQRPAPLSDATGESPTPESGHPQQAPHCCRICATAFALITMDAAPDWIPTVELLHHAPLISVQAAEAPTVSSCPGRGPPA